MRWTRTDHDSKVAPIREAITTALLQARFELYVIPVTESGCFIWTGSKSRKKGNTTYGLFWLNGRNRSAHRVSWEIYIGPIQQGMNVCHKCDMPLCVNPNHLFLGTDADNMADMIKKGRQRHPKGEELPKGEKRKLTENDVIAIRADSRLQKDIATSFGVDNSIISDIKNRKSWRHI